MVNGRNPTARVLTSYVTGQSLGIQSNTRFINMTVETLYTGYFTTPGSF